MMSDCYVCFMLVVEAILLGYLGRVHVDILGVQIYW